MFSQQLQEDRDGKREEQIDRKRGGRNRSNKINNIHMMWESLESDKTELSEVCPCSCKKDSRISKQMWTSI